MYIYLYICNRKIKTRNCTALNFVSILIHQPTVLSTLVSCFHPRTGGCVRVAALDWPCAYCTALHYLSCYALVCFFRL